ncbi:uncharacterized protein [Atheta coriaria]|uniref:uncharacterized protein n=1 Tax=Dalotia coriaria TaxID=877792 RepID=UPI0031F466DE
MPKMSKLDTLIAAANFIEEHEHKLLASPQQQQQSTTTPVVPAAVLQPTAAPLSHVQTPPAVVLHQVLQPALAPIQHVTIQHAPANGHIITAQPVNTIRIHHKKDVVNVAAAPGVNRLAVMNSFDLINPAVIDQGSGEVKRKQPPMAFRTGTREVHNKLEKNRRAHLKDCFEELNSILPNARDAAAKKTSNLQILDSALKYIGVLKTEEADHEQLLEQLAKEKIRLKQRYSNLRKEIKSLFNVDVPDAPEENMRKRRKEKRDAVTTTNVSTTLTTTAPQAVVAVASPTTVVDRVSEAATPLTAGTTTTVAPAAATAAAATTATMVGNVLKLPKSITAAAATAGKDVSEGGAITFAGYPLAAGNGSLVLVPKTLDPHQHQQLTAQFVSAHHHHHHHHAAADAKVIVNAQYVVKPLVVVSTPSRPS